MSINDWIAPDAMKGKVVFITGGGSGINLGIGKTFARVGADVAICGRSLERLEGAARELEALGARVSASVADVRDYDALAAALETSRRELGSVDVLVCGAAGNFVARAEAMNAKGFRTVVEIDLLGSFNASHAAFGQLKETRGSILFISAGQSVMPFVGQSHGGAAKAGIDNLMASLALEWGRFGIRSNALVPGAIAGTEGMKRLDEAAGEDTWTSMIPLGRYGGTDEVGAMAVMLSLPLSSYVTGTRVVVDGGMALSGSGLYNRAVSLPALERLTKMPPR
ncbi:SDR family oxidoreductase [Nitratireductor mangrovi]|uniref:SDR family oxidoreductase n=1 Tax=Nitratireductor mangrovi TaxID=2599600 RepID=A0A5B8KY84_9HYPH|nr:SDR family oxidoreductase [Nitratireductor mangrovi]QDZ00573.1 SDR family oxidoreductase [Nitratireductor mangrovi]